MGTSGQKLDENTRARIISMLSRGIPFRDIAIENRVNITTVWRVDRAAKAAGGIATARYKRKSFSDNPCLPSGSQSATKSVIYIMGSEELSVVKIGFSSSLDGALGRVDSAQTYCHALLRIEACFPGTAKDERCLHKRFAAYRVRGEWFTRTGEIEKFITEQKSAFTSKAWQVGRADAMKS